METEIVLNVKVEALDEGGFLATSSDLPGLVVQGRTRSETLELAQANARILMEVFLSEKLPLPPALRRVLKRKTMTLTLSLPVLCAAEWLKNFYFISIDPAMVGNDYLR